MGILQGFSVEQETNKNIQALEDTYCSMSYQVNVILSLYDLA